MKWWPFSKKTEPVTGHSIHPFIALELYPDGKVVPHCLLPNPTNQEQADEDTYNYALMLHMLNNGHLLHVIQHGVVAAGIKSGYEGISGMILEKYNEISDELDNQPVVDPTIANNPNRYINHD